MRFFFRWVDDLEAWHIFDKVSAKAASSEPQCYKTSHRMHIEGPRYTKWTVRLVAFRICVTCYRQKMTIWPRKSPILENTNLRYLTSKLEGPGRQTVDTSSTFRWDTEIGKKVIFGVKRSIAENFQGDFFWGPVPTESLLTQDSELVLALGDRASVLKL